MAKRAKAVDVARADAQAAALAIMVQLAEQSARIDLLAHSIGLMFGVPKGAFAAALAAHRKQPKRKGE